ncbi:MAG: hypothetical protein K5829_07025 [Treponema sp.]|nr:hypothetical protein [Treponema sp.]
MKNRLLVIYGIIVSLIYAFAVGFFAYNIISEYKNGYKRTQITFDTMAHNVKAAVLKGDSSTFSKDIEDSVASLNDYMSIEIKLNGQLFYIYPNENVSGGKMTRSLFMTDKVNDINIYINANLYLLRPYTIFSYARISFLIILITTLITIILLIYFSFVEKQLVSDNKDDDEDNSEIEYYEEKDSIDESSKLNEENNIIKDKSDSQEISNELEKENKESFSVNDSEIEVEEKKENDESTNPDNESLDNSNSELDIPGYEESEDENVEAELLKDNETPEEDIKEKEEAVLPSEEVKPMHIDNIAEEEPSGLFSPTTGFGWPQYFNTRLENELNRATSSEIDLALFILRIPGMDKTNEDIISICHYLSEQFQFADLIFEYKDDCFAAIKIGMNLDEALTFADKLHLEIENKLSLQEKHCYIGISTRTIRLISADRIIKEAEEALVHAQAEPDSPIIAFRVDVAKYKEFVEKN